MAELLTSVSFGTEAAGNDRVQSAMQDKNRAKRRPLTPFERQTIESGEINPIYIYNVSPIHEWARPQGQLGTVVIPKRGWKDTISSPRVIKGAIVRWVSKGLSIEPFIEGGQEVAEDVCGCSPRYDGTHPNSNLTRYGVFMTHKPFDVEFLPDAKRKALSAAPTAAKAKELKEEWIAPAHEQKQLISEATTKLIEELQFTILTADNWHQSGPQQRQFIGEWHRLNLRAFNEITGRKESRPWSTILMGENMMACGFCGNMGKPGLAKCPNCKEILNVEAYNKLKLEIGA